MIKYKGHLISINFTPKGNKIICIKQLMTSNNKSVEAFYNIGKGDLDDIVYITMAKGLIDHVFLGEEVANYIKDIDLEYVKNDLMSYLQDDIIEYLYKYNLKFNKPSVILPEDKEYVLILLDRDMHQWCDDDDPMDKRYYVVAQYDRERNRFDEFGPDSYDIDEVAYWSYLPNYIKEEM